MKTFICNNCKRFTYESEKCEYCGCTTLTETHFYNSKSVEKSDRELALEWWNNDLFYNHQREFNYKINGDFSIWLNEDQIEQIWKKETQQLREDADCCFQRIDEKPQVDFGRLSLTLNHILSNNEITKYYAQSELFNLELFLELLSKSSAFAHKAHKELKKLNSK